MEVCEEICLVDIIGGVSMSSRISQCSCDFQGLLNALFKRGVLGTTCARVRVALGVSQHLFYPTWQPVIVPTIVISECVL